jgi:long-chain acyl-CoA synthetase
LIQGWGLTEASPVITGQVISPFDFHFTRRIEQQAGSVGRPIQGVEVALIDVPEKNVYVPIHGEGELVARGPNIMLGYYKNEAATSRAMLGDWLRTGDMGCIDKGGNVYITGRAKYVIVLDSGEKVYPEEVEERLAESPLVADVCVVGRQVRRLTGGSRIEVTAVVHPNIEAVRERARLDPPSLSADTVRRWVSEDIARLQQDGPAFKRVTEVVLTDTPLPKTPLRKVRRELVSDHHDFDLHRFLEGET